MKKLALLIVSAFLIMSLTGCGFFMQLFSTDEGAYTLYLESSLENVDLSRPHQTTFSSGDQITVEAPIVEGYRFDHWLNLDTNLKASTSRSYTFNITGHTRLKAIYREAVYFNLNVSSNAGSNAVTLSNEGPLLEQDAVTLTALDVSGYTFHHWLDLDTLEIVSFNEVYSYVVFRNRNIEAVYVPDTKIHVFLYSNITDITGGHALEREVISINKGDMFNFIAADHEAYTFKHYYDFTNQRIISDMPELNQSFDTSIILFVIYETELEPKLFYRTGFDDATKGSYTGGEVETDNRAWWFEEALLGLNQNDLFDGVRSVRLRNSGSPYIETLFTISDAYKIEFDAGIFIGDTHTDLRLYISTNQEDWTLVETYNLDNTLQTFTQSLLEYADQEIYIRLKGTGVSRTNIDNLSIYRRNLFAPDYPEIIAKEGTVTFPNNSERLTINFNANFKEHYSYGDIWDPSHCVAIDIIIGALECNVYGYVNTQVLGEYEVTYYAIDEDGNYASMTYTKVVLKDATLLNYNYDQYYEGLNGLYGEALLLALREIIQEGVILQRYEDAKTILAEADVHPTDPNSVLAIYSHSPVPRVWDSVSWHREHVWPNSLLGIARTTETQRNIGSDLHNLRAIIPSINSSRSNKFFTDTVTSDTYYPGDDDLGDVARILFYMVTMYPHLTLIEDVLPNDPDTNYTPDGAFMGALSFLIMWHFLDPVDAFEINRNEVIYTYQFNRNPFIDYPHLVELIFFDHPSIPLSS
ncbi:MAG: endonuclease I family protein [Candidatus Izemoplasmataceae bacterium]